MKKTFLAAFVGLFCLTATAQYRPTFIIQAGYQGANVSGNSAIKTDMHHGFRVGAAADFSVYTDDMVEMSIQPGVNFVTKGFAKNTENGKFSTTLNYIEVPVLVNARFAAGDNLNAFVNAGPYFAYGIGGKVSGEAFGIKGEIKDANPFKKTKLGDKEYSAANAFDAGLQIGAGIEYSRFLVGVGAQYGLTKVFNNALDDKSKNVGFFVSAGYRF